MESNLGLPLSPNLSIKARSHFAIFVDATLIAATTAHSKNVVVKGVKMTDSTLGHHLLLSPHLSIKARSHIAIVAAATLISHPLILLPPLQPSLLLCSYYGHWPNL
jgi:hypothetical protein